MNSQHQKITIFNFFLTLVFFLTLNSCGPLAFKKTDVKDSPINDADMRKRNIEQGRGFTYKKFFCIAFDLALLTTYRKESFYRFVYHDDVFANQDNRPKNKLLELTKKICKEEDIQYIFTIIKDELPRDESDNLVTFTDEEIILNLHDKDETGTLFGINF